MFQTSKLSIVMILRYWWLAEQTNDKADFLLCIQDYNCHRETQVVEEVKELCLKQDCDLIRC